MVVKLFLKYEERKVFVSFSCYSLISSLTCLKLLWLHRWRLRCWRRELQNWNKISSAAASAWEISKRIQIWYRGGSANIIVGLMRFPCMQFMRWAPLLNVLLLLQLLVFVFVFPRSMVVAARHGVDPCGVTLANLQVKWADEPLLLPCVVVVVVEVVVLALLG